MVKNLRSLQIKLGQRIPDAVERHLREQMSKRADFLVSTMKFLVPERFGDLKRSINWVWGEDIPDGAISLGSFVGSSQSDLVITVYAGNEDAFYARWVEFGTQPHSLAKSANALLGRGQSSGTQHPGANATPFFFPAWRVQKRRIKSGISRAIKRGLQQGAK